MDFIKTYWPDSAESNENNFYSEIKVKSLYNFALSSLLLTKYKNVTLYTNEKGAEIANVLNIPFSEITVINTPFQRYNSFNDLYVLSLQGQPRVFVDNSLFVMGDIKLEVQNDFKECMTTLCVDLDSLRLVKALIKIKRITEKIPFLDDSLWMDKTAYIDTSLILFNNNKLLNKYLEKVRSFLDEHSQQLSLNISPNIIDDFIKRFWIFSYFKLNGSHFETYFDNPLDIVYRPYDRFAFSPRNVIKNILRPRGYNWSDEQNSIHFSLFFKQHFPDKFEYINQHLKKNKQKYTVFYIRSMAILEKAEGNPSSLSHTSSKFSDKYVKAVMNNSHEFFFSNSFYKELFVDAAQYEKFLNKVFLYYKKNRQKIVVSQQKAFELLIRYWDDVDQYNKSITLVTNPFLFLCESYWKWNIFWIRGIPRYTLAKLKVIYNSCNPSHYYATAFLPDTEQRQVFELNVDRVSGEILTHFSTKSTIKSFFDDLTGNPIFSNTGDSQARNTNYEERIKDLLLINALTVYEN